MKTDCYLIFAWKPKGRKIRGFVRGADVADGWRALLELWGWSDIIIRRI